MVVRIGDRLVGDGQPCFIVSELGINHGGHVEVAERLIRAAADAGADAVKFQRRSVGDLLTRAAREAAYESPHAYAPTYGEHRQALELPDHAWPDLQALAAQLGLLFFASACDKRSVDFLAALGVPCHKIPSPCLTDPWLLDYAAQKGLPVVLSTGMSTLNEVDEAARIVRRHHDRLILLQCCSAYPSRPQDLNLRVMEVYRKRYKVAVGYSGHETGLVPTLAAVALGACVVERHFTLDRTMKGSDHRASLEPDDFKRLVEGIREVEAALGDGVKRFLLAELAAWAKLGKSVVAARPIARRAELTPGTVTFKGPGTGIPASRYAEVMAARVRDDVEADTCLSPAVLKRSPWRHRLFQVPVLLRAHYALLRRLNRRPVAVREAVRLTWLAVRPARFWSHRGLP